MENLKSRRTVERVLEYLTAMHNDRHGIIEWQSKNPVALARFIRVGIHASFDVDSFKHFADLINVYKIRIIGNSRVVAEPRLMAVGYRVPIPTDSTQLFPEVYDLSGIIGACIKAGKPARAGFPNVKLAVNELELLYRWCQIQQPLYYIINHDEAGVTVTSINPGDESQWKPAQQSSSQTPSESTSTKMQSVSESGSS